MSELTVRSGFDTKWVCHKFMKVNHFSSFRISELWKKDWGSSSRALSLLSVRRWYKQVKYLHVDSVALGVHSLFYPLYYQKCHLLCSLPVLQLEGNECVNVSSNKENPQPLGERELWGEGIHWIPEFPSRVQFWWPTAAVCLIMNFLLVLFPSLSHFPIPLPKFPGIIFKTNSLHFNFIWSGLGGTQSYFLNRLILSYACRRGSTEQWGIHRFCIKQT